MLTTPLRLCAVGLSSILLMVSACGHARSNSPTAAGQVQVQRFASIVFFNLQTLRVWLPPGYNDPENANRKYPVLYMFDGQNLFKAGSSGNQASKWNVDETLKQLIGQGKVEPLIVVGIDAPRDQSRRGSEYAPFIDPAGPIQFVPHGDKLPEFITKEVMPRVEHGYRVKTDWKDTAIGGSSFGGVASLYLLETIPNVFGRALIESPSPGVGNGELIRRAMQMPETAWRVYVGVGDHEADDYRTWIEGQGYYSVDRWNRVFVKGARDVADNLKASGGDDIDVKFVEDPEGWHDNASWAIRFPAAIEFLFPASGQKSN